MGAAVVGSITPGPVLGALPAGWRLDRGSYHVGLPATGSLSGRRTGSGDSGLPGYLGTVADAGHIQLDGDASALDDLAAVMDDFDPNFNIITP